MPRILIIVMVAAALSPVSSAQMRGRAGVAARGTGFRHLRSGGFGYPFFYSDYGPESEAAPPQPPVVVEQRVFQPERPTEPLLIEWQGDRFVRHGEAQTAEAPDFAEAPPARAASPAVSREIPPAVLVYRDGHREEVSDYVITRGILYARDDFWQGRSHDVHLSALDIAATFKLNQNNGVNFALPVGPNDVVTRP